MFQPVTDSNFVPGEHSVLQLWQQRRTFRQLRQKNSGSKRWSFLDGPITANNPMGVHHAWGRTYKDTYQRFFAMTGHKLRYQNGFDCQGLWVEVEVEKQLGLGSKTAVKEYGIDNFVNECKRRVLRFAARQTEQSIRLGYWMDWDDPDQLRRLAETLGTDQDVTITVPSGRQQTGKTHQLVEKLGSPGWGGSYFTFSTENNETIWAFLKKCFNRGKIFLGHDVMPWSGRGGSAYSQMEIAEGRKLTTHKSVFVRFPLKDRHNEFLLIWTTTPWTLTSNVGAAVNPDLEYVRVRANRDDAVYYFAKENLHFQRLSTEFKEGFGRPEWKWPKTLPKLKTLAQIFKEQGGFEELGTLQGSDLVGLTYEGPFDDLPAQQLDGGYPIDEKNLGSSGATWHRVVDGGRDSRGMAHVVAGEGTGIVHMAPGCGDIDHRIGASMGMPVIAPLREDGTYGDDFGDFSGREAIAPETAELVFEKLKEKGLLVAVETYPHIYPHCWRTGDELVFRLVDEWFINMDWRDEIKEVTREIRWLPDSINGQEREVEWLTNMSDWMISKKRFWGLALPIWLDDETGEFEVIGSLAELKDRAVEGWDEFEGHTPHRPWIDCVKIRSRQSGNLMSRIEDVGNPWLDAGIVPFSTMHYNHDHAEWLKWYPADLVTECFPGQFRNWFYSMLSLSTMMRYDEADSASDKRPFKTLLGHRLVQNEQGKPMHKSDGTAIWFEEAAEQLGVDTMRWMYLAQNPAADLRFGTRHRDDPVTLQTPEGPLSETREGVATVRVTSGPADEMRRRILIPLWNCYRFFVDYAIADGFEPANALRQFVAGVSQARGALIPVNERPEIDRWLLSNLQSLVDVAHTEFPEFNVAAFCEAAERFIDDLSNWYIRRNRRRFWRSKDASDLDKTAAYETLYEVLVTVCRLLAPCIPFLTERMYQNLIHGGQSVTNDSALPSSIHLCDYPVVSSELLDEGLNRRMKAAQKVVRLGHQLREENTLRVRQPLAELQFSASDSATADAINQLANVIAEELNVKTISRQDNLDDKVGYAYKPNLRTLGPKYGKLLGALRQQVPALGDTVLSPLRYGESLTIEVNGNTVDLTPDDVLISTEQAADWVCADETGIQVAMSTVLTAGLIREGMSRDFVRHIQQLRKDAAMNIQDRIVILWYAEDNLVDGMIAEWEDYICGETLADTITRSESFPAVGKPARVGECDVTVWIHPPV
ncbi:MAG: class I tRNA ligase family protein [Planctomycetaceae bacterium]